MLSNRPETNDLTRYEGYQVMVNGRETEILTLDRDEAIRQLAFCIDRIEEMDEQAAALTKIIKNWREGSANG